jgi:hypothetical protein
VVEILTGPSPKERYECTDGKFEESALGPSEVLTRPVPRINVKYTDSKADEDALGSALKSVFWYTVSNTFEKYKIGLWHPPYTWIRFPA